MAGFVAALFVMLLGYLARGVGDGGVERDAPATEAEAEGVATAEGERGAPFPDFQTLDEALGRAAGSGDASERVVEDELSGAATSLLEEYEQQDGVLLVRSGWVDLLGRVWGCVLMGPGWVDVCLASEEVGGAQTRIRTLRMEVSEWRDSYAEVGKCGP